LRSRAIDGRPTGSKPFRISTIKLANLADTAPDFAADGRARELIALLASGGDARITLDPASGFNRYMSTPYPCAVLAYASSTANDMSPAAFGHLLEQQADGSGREGYAERLDGLRDRLRRAYGLEGDTAIVFAPSGTDLEYVALAAARGKAPEGIHNVLLGADEVGSGCIHSAHGRYFAQETALGRTAVPGEPVAGLGSVSLADIPVRCEQGLPQDSTAISDAIAQEIELARAGRRHALVHVVHGSKTGLILPEMAELEGLRAQYGDNADFVVDACQARIDAETVNAYLARGMIVFLSGSKFMGGPPFSGFALVPRAIAAAAAALPAGFAQIFRRAEWPADWAGRDILADEGNPGLTLRLEGSIFELERFAALPQARVARAIDGFVKAVRSELVEPLGLDIVATHGEAGAARQNPIEMRTLVTLDLSAIQGLETYEDARKLHRSMALAGVRLGQPVQCVRRGGVWGPTMRVCLSMPQFSDLDAKGGSLEDQLALDMQRIARELAAA